MRRRRSTRARDKTSRDMNEVDTGDGWEKGIAMTSKAHWATAEKVDLPAGSPHCGLGSMVVLFWCWKHSVSVCDTGAQTVEMAWSNPVRSILSHSHGL